MKVGIEYKKNEKASLVTNFNQDFQKCIYAAVCVKNLLLT